MNRLKWWALLAVIGMVGLASAMFWYAHSNPKDSSFSLGRAFGVAMCADGESTEYLWDTGSEYSFLTRGAAREGGLSIRALESPITLRDSLGHEQMIVSESTGVICSMFDGKQSPGRLLIIDDPGEWFPFGGIIGRDTILEWDWIVDCRHGLMLRLARGGLGEGLARYGFRERDRLPIRVGENGILIRLRLNRRLEVDAQVDTGAWRTLLPAQMIAELGLPNGASVEREQAAREAKQIAEALRSSGIAVGEPTVSISNEIVGINGSGRSSSAFLLGALELGTVREENVVVSESPSGAVVLGADVLRRWKWAFDSELLCVWIAK